MSVRVPVAVAMACPQCGKRMRQDGGARVRKADGVLVRRWRCYVCVVIVAPPRVSNAGRPSEARLIAAS